jgi:putative transposase
MNLYLKALSKEYTDDTIILVLDGASWHRSGALIVPDNIRLVYLPPATPEMNPIEQIWTWLRCRGFRNETFTTLDKVVSRLCDTICSLSAPTIKSITGRNWILSMF